MDSRITHYNPDLLTGGLTVDEALALFNAACNKHDTLFITPSWFGPRERRLRALLDDPITTINPGLSSSSVVDHEKVKFFEHAPVDREWLAGALGRSRRRGGARKSLKGSIHAL